MRLWHFLSSVNSFFLHTCAAIQSFIGARCLIFGRTFCLLPYLMWANSEGSCETARMRRLAFAGRLCDKYHYLMSWLILLSTRITLMFTAVSASDIKFLSSHIHSLYSPHPDVHPDSLSCPHVSAIARLGSSPYNITNVQPHSSENIWARCSCTVWESH